MFEKIKGYFLKNFEAKQIIVKNSFWIFFSRFLGSIFRAVLVILSFRILGPSLQGSFYLAMNFILIFSVIPDFGLVPIFIKNLTQEKEKKKETIANFVYSFFLLFLLSFFLIILIHKFVIKDSLAQKIILILIPFIFFDTLREILYSLFRAEEKMEFQALSYSLTNFLLMSFGLFVLFNYPHPLNLALAYLFSSFLGLIFTFFLLRKDLFFNYLKFIRLKEPLIILNKSWPIGIANFIFLLITYIDTLILGYFRAKSEVGIYNSVVKINEVLFILPLSLAMAIYPRLTKELNDKQRFHEALEFGFNFSLLISLPTLFGIFFFSYDLINFLYGKEYLSANLALKFLSFSIPFNFFFLILVDTLIALDRRKELIKFDLIVLLINALLNLIFVPLYGLYASSLITSFSSFLSFLFGFLLVKKYINFHLKQLNLIKPLFASFAAVFLVYFLPIHLIFKIILVVITYFLFLYFVKDPILKEIFKFIQ